MIVNNNRRKRYALEGSYWNNQFITWRIEQTPSLLSKQIVRMILRQAFAVWEEYSNLYFVYNEYGPVNIEISFVKGFHGDGEAFDGPGQVLAHSFFPRFGGQIHFDDDENWSLNSGYNKVDLYFVAVHEIGHALGLKHSENHMAIMSSDYYNAYLSKTNNKLHLTMDDRLGLNKIYPLKSIQQESSCQKNIFKAARKFCRKPKVDAISMDSNGGVYAFIGEFFYKFSPKSRKFDLKRARRIAKIWPDINFQGENNFLDGVISFPNEDWYFFKNNRYWIYENRTKLKNGFPKIIKTNLRNFSPKINSALIWKENSADQTIFVFIGEKFWRFPANLTKFDSLSMFEQNFHFHLRQIFKNRKDHRTSNNNLEVPRRIDAAFNLRNGAESYLIAGEDLYRLYPLKRVKHRSYAHLPQARYAKKISRVLFNCNEFEDLK